MQNDYSNIINLPHHVSTTHPRMSSRDRAAQFSSFAALTGYDDEVKETARLTDEKIEPDEYSVSRINVCLQILIDKAFERPKIMVTCFKADEKKVGGAYMSIEGNFRRIDESDNTIVFTDGTRIRINDIYSIEGELFDLIEE